MGYLFRIILKYKNGFLTKKNKIFWQKFWAATEIYNIPDIYERAIEYFCYSVRGQLFWDGNKRTSTIIASKILISEGKGVLTIGKKEALSFNEALLHFYDTADSRLLKECLMGCIKGRDM